MVIPLCCHVNGRYVLIFFYFIKLYLYVKLIYVWEMICLKLYLYVNGRWYVLRYTFMLMGDGMF